MKKIIILFLIFLDAVLTFIAKKLGMFEVNPIINFFYNYLKEYAPFLHFVYLAFLIYLPTRWNYFRDPKYYKIVIIALTIILTNNVIQLIRYLAGIGPWI
jgi:hypothetical protein